ncbi:PQQ-binding-like beta-propeller repeat protein [Planctomycetota bacterium]
MKQNITTAVIVILVAGASWAESHSARMLDNWPAWRGPLANGVAPHADPPMEWGPSKNIKWKLDLPGHSNATPIIWADRVFVVTAAESDKTVDQLSAPTMEPPGGYRTKRTKHYYQFQVYCIDRQTGHILWQRIAAEKVPHEGRHGTNTYASGSPTTDGQRLYVTFGSHGLFCYDLDGNLLWQRDLGDMITRFGWGEGASPTVCGDALVVNWDHEGSSTVYVLDAKTGQTRWTAQRDEETTWSTPLIVTYKGTRQLIINATRRVTSYDLDSSRILWECGGQTAVLIPSPVVLDDMVICMSGYRRAAAYAIGLDATGDITGTGRIRWQYNRNTPYVPSPLLYGERLYFTKGNRATLSCLNAKTGKPLMENVRLPDLRELYASPLGAADRIYFVGRDGTTVVIKNQPELNVLAVNRLDDPMDASPVAVGGELFLRSKTRLYCIARTDH